MHNIPKRQRRGIISVLAMLYLILFSTLAIGFYAVTTTQMQIVANDERTARAQLAAESGMDFMRYQLARVSIPPEPLPPDQVVIQLHAELDRLLDGTGNLDGQSIALEGNTIQLPADGGAIPLDVDGRSRFRGTITDWAGEIVVKVEGISGTTNRAITMDFTRVEHTTTAFNYAVASKGQIVVKKGAVTSVAGVEPSIATLMSSSNMEDAIYVRQNATIGGDIFHVAGGNVNITPGASIGGTNSWSEIFSDHVHQADELVWPDFDTSVYAPYATNTWSPGQPLVNARIPANTNPKFSGNQIIQGIVYIEAPNRVEFTGNVNLQGFIVFENQNDDSENRLTFTGNVTQSPVPNSPEFDALRATSGVAILAPTAAVSMTGSVSSGDSYLRGSVITSTFSYSGAAAIQIDQGTVMGLKDAPNSVVIDGAKSIRFTGTGAGNAPSMGMSHRTYFAPDPTSYLEISP